MHKIQKLYFAILVGKLKRTGGTIRASLTKSKMVGTSGKDIEGKEEKIMLAETNAKDSVEAATQYNIIETIGNVDSGYVCFFEKIF
jgi:hypothetical protein